MRRGAAADAEVVGRGDEAAAEVMLPDPIDHHPRREGVIGARQPLGKLEPAAPRDSSRERCLPEHGDESSRHRVAEVVGLATPLDPRVSRRPLGHRVGHWHRALGEKPPELRGERIAPRFEGRKRALQ